MRRTALLFGYNPAMHDFQRLLQALATLWLIVFASHIQAAGNARQDVASIERTAERFARQQLEGSDARLSITHLDPKLYLPQCSQLEAFLPSGGKLIGRSFVGVRCNGPTAWSINIPIQVSLSMDVVIAAHPLRAGQLIAADDLGSRRLDQEGMPSGVLTSPQQAIGRQPIVGIAAGLPLRADMLRAPLVIQAGQIVKLRVNGEGFQVSTEARALGQAAVGQNVAVRTASGQVVQGVAQGPGEVLASP